MRTPTAYGPGSVAISLLTADSSPVANSARPVISASGGVSTNTTGAILSVSTGTFTGSNLSYTYQWFRCNAATSTGTLNGGSACTPITGETSTTYTGKIAGTTREIRLSANEAKSIASKSSTSG